MLYKNKKEIFYKNLGDHGHVIKQKREKIQILIFL